MIFPFFYWVVLPLLAGWGLVTLIKRSPRPVAPDVAALVAKEPLTKDAYAAARRDAEGLHPLGVFEKLIEASDAAYRDRADSLKSGRKAAFLVFGADGVVVEQIDS
ncbi:MAG: hypothetical protein HYZ75_04040 [Elusimicrobia bacterium]|nr:hypothetical protein [Elusimicrobiota bacterium]